MGGGLCTLHAGACSAPVLFAHVHPPIKFLQALERGLGVRPTSVLLRGGPREAAAAAALPRLELPSALASTAAAVDANLPTLSIAAYLARVRRAVLVRDVRASIVRFCDEAAIPASQLPAPPPSFWNAHAAVRDALAAALASDPPCYHVQHFLLLREAAAAAPGVAPLCDQPAAFSRPRLSGPGNEQAEQLFAAVFAHYACPAESVAAHVWLRPEEEEPAASVLTLWQWRALLLDAGIVEGVVPIAHELDAVFLRRAAGADDVPTAAAAQARLAACPPLVGSAGPALPYASFAPSLVDAASILLTAGSPAAVAAAAVASAVADALLCVARSEGLRLSSLFEARCERTLEMATGLRPPSASVVSPRSPPAVAVAPPQSPHAFPSTSPRLELQRSARNLDPSVSRPLLRLPQPLRDRIMQRYGIVVSVPAQRPPPPPPVALGTPPLLPTATAADAQLPEPLLLTRPPDAATQSSGSGGGGGASGVPHLRTPQLLQQHSDPGPLPSVGTGGDGGLPPTRPRGSSTSGGGGGYTQRGRVGSICSTAGGDATPAAVGGALQLLAASSTAMVEEAERSSALHETPSASAPSLGRRSSRPIVTEVRPGAEDAAVIARRIDAMHSGRRRSSVLAPAGSGTIGSARKLSTPHGHAAAAAAASAAFSAASGSPPSPVSSGVEASAKLSIVTSDLQQQQHQTAGGVRIHASPTSAFSSRPSQLLLSGMMPSSLGDAAHPGGLLQSSVLLMPFSASDATGATAEVAAPQFAQQRGALAAGIGPVHFGFTSPTAAVAPVDAAGVPRGSDALRLALASHPAAPLGTEPLSPPAVGGSPKEATTAATAASAGGATLRGASPLVASPHIARVRRMSEDLHAEGTVLPPSVINVLLRQRMQPVQDALDAQTGSGGVLDGSPRSRAPYEPQPNSGRSSTGLPSTRLQLPFVSGRCEGPEWLGSSAAMATNHSHLLRSLQPDAWPLARPAGWGGALVLLAAAAAAPV